MTISQAFGGYQDRRRFISYRLAFRGSISGFDIGVFGFKFGSRAEPVVKNRDTES